MNKNDYEQKVHDKEFTTLMGVITKIKKGFFTVRSVTLSKELVGSGWRLIVYLREKSKNEKHN